MTASRMAAAALAALALGTAAQVDAAPAHGMAALEARLQRAEDMLAIQQLLGDYTVEIDAKDWGAYSALFADDGELIFSSARAKGPEAIRKVMQATTPAG